MAKKYSCFAKIDVDFSEKLKIVESYVKRINSTVKYYNLVDVTSDGIHAIGCNLVFNSDDDIIFKFSLKKENIDKTIQELKKVQARSLEKE
jgi:hypothetical protein